MDNQTGRRGTRETQADEEVVVPILEGVQTELNQEVSLMTEGKPPKESSTNLLDFVEIISKSFIIVKMLNDFFPHTLMKPDQLKNKVRHQQTSKMKGDDECSGQVNKI